MIEESKRARRIKDIQRMKAKAERVGVSNGLPGNWAKEYNHLAMCSCHMCRNPRRSNFYSGNSRLTLQERKHIEAWS